MTAEPTAPALSVVVPSVNGWEELRECLQALDAERSLVALEVIVVDRLGEAVRRPVAGEFPWVTVLAAPERTTIPALRAMGFERARGTAVAVIEDHVLVPRGWASALLGCLTAGEDVAGGAVVNAATERLVDRAAFLCEYHHLLPPVPAGVVSSIAGNNTVYRREVLSRFGEVWRMGRWEDVLHEAMRRSGVMLHQHPEIVVGHRMHYTVGGYLGQRYLFSRAWAGMAARERSWLARAARGAGSVLLPLVMFCRVVRTVWGKGAHRRELVESLPLIGLFTLAWGAGEVAGNWFGPGDALARVR